MNNILIDTNVLRRQIEGNAVVTKLLDKLFKDNKIILSDLSIFEYLDATCDCTKIHKFICKYSCGYLYRKSSEIYFDNYEKIRTNPNSVEIMKSILFTAFENSLSTFLANVYSLLMLALANSLSKGDYNSNFYCYVRNLYENEDIRSKFQAELKTIIQKGYIDNTLKVEKYIRDGLKDLFERELAYFKLFEINNEFTSEELQDELMKIEKRYYNKTFKDILNEYVEEKALVIVKPKNMSQLSYDFLCGYLNLIVFCNGKFSINDVVDFLNFENAYEHNFLYFTLDKKSINKFITIFKNNANVIAYIYKCNSIIEMLK